MNTTDDLFRSFLMRLATHLSCEVDAAAKSLTDHNWAEVAERDAFYPALHRVLVESPLDIKGVYECVKREGKSILGGHPAFRARLTDFFAWEMSAEALQGLVGDAVSPPTDERIDEFVQRVVEHGFRHRSGSPAGGDAIYFTSVLLTAVFPDTFVECRKDRWDWMARQFDLPNASEAASYAISLKTVGAAARQLTETPTFRGHFSSAHPLWTAGAIAYLLYKDPQLKCLVEGGAMPVALAPTIREAFALFRDDPVSRFMVRLRSHRASQLRELLSDPEKLTLETFNREVWCVMSAATLDGEDVLPLLMPGAQLTSEQLHELDAGIETGALEVHGNGMWGSGSRIYGPMVPGDDNVRLQNIRRALEILNDENLSPFNKATQIEEIPGFGSNAATGLVMAFHPDEFAIWNTPSSGAIAKLGYTAGNLEAFERVAADLRKGLGAKDYIELDFFLFLVDLGHLKYAPAQPAWWVCQGTNYKLECQHGYLFACKETTDGKEVQHHSNLALMQLGQAVLHYADGAIQAVGSVNATATERTRPHPMPGEAAGRIGYFVPVDYQELLSPIALEEIPEDWRKDGERPFNRNGKVKQGYLFQLSSTFLARLKERFADRFPMNESIPQSQRIVKIAPGEGAKFWDECRNGSYICVGWGKTGDLLQFSSKEQFRDRFTEEFGETYNNHGPTISRKANEVWTLRNLKPGDVVVANQGTARILAVGEVLDPPYEYVASDEYPHHIRVRWDSSVAKDIPKQPFWALTTIAEVPADLYEFILGNEEIPLDLKPPTKDYFEPPFEQIRDKILSHGMRISDRMLKRYHISLKTRGFVILSGLSGSGKTWLAELYAKAMGAQQELVPVAPNWTTNEDLLGYLNPIEGLYHDTPASRFLRRAAEAYEDAVAAGIVAQPFHLILDEMNLARVEYYFAKFLSVMEQRSRSLDARIDLGGGQSVLLPPNLYFVGTVNIDETTHGFADKIYDRAHLLEMTVERDDLRTHLGTVPYSAILMEIWDGVQHVAPFAFRVLDEAKSYIDQAAKVGVPWEQAVDEILLQKVLTKFKGAEHRVKFALEQFIAKTADAFPLSHAKSKRMLETLQQHGITSYF